MDRIAADAVTAAFIKEIHRLLSEAANIAKAAAICAESGSIPVAVNLVMDFEDPAFLAQQMLKATLLIRRELLAEQID